MNAVNVSGCLCTGITRIPQVTSRCETHGIFWLVARLYTLLPDKGFPVLHSPHSGSGSVKRGFPMCRSRDGDSPSQLTLAEITLTTLGLLFMMIDIHNHLLSLDFEKCILGSQALLLLNWLRLFSKKIFWCAMSLHNVSDILCRPTLYFKNSMKYLKIIEFYFNLIFIV